MRAGSQQRSKAFMEALRQPVAIKSVYGGLETVRAGRRRRSKAFMEASGRAGWQPVAIKSVYGGLETVWAAARSDQKRLWRP